jgi:hypothetical protein
MITEIRAASRLMAVIHGDMVYGWVDPFTHTHTHISIQHAVLSLVRFPTRVYASRGCNMNVPRSSRSAHGARWMMSCVLYAGSRIALSELS